MSQYNHKTRIQLMNEYKNQIQKKAVFQLLLANKETKAIMKELRNFSDYREPQTPYINKSLDKFQNGKYDSISELMKKEYLKLIELYIPKEYHNQYYYIIDKYTQFSYSKYHNRRTVRCNEPVLWVKRALRLIYDYYMFEFYECTISQYLKNELSEEKCDYKQNCSYDSEVEYLDDMIAAQLDLGNEELKNNIKEILFSENNTSVVTVELIRGILKSSVGELHKLLGDFMLAARLQEGVRQAVCENMDCGTKEGFLALFPVICDHNLVRYSSVKRAIATWTGIFDESNVDRITNKILSLMKECLFDLEKRRQYSNSNDSIEIMIALWAMGFENVDLAIERMEQYWKFGTRNQKLTMSYYNISLYHYKICGIISKKIFEEFSEDFEMLAAFLPMYLSETNNLIWASVKEEKKGVTLYHVPPVTELFENKEEAFKHFQILRDVYEALPNKTLRYSPCIFPWHGVSLSKGQLMKRMCLIAYVLEQDDLIEYTAGQLSSIDNSDGYHERSLCLEILLHQPRTTAQKQLLVSYIGDKQGDTRDTAYKLVKKVKLDETNYVQLEQLLKFKTGDIRKHCIELLNTQPTESIPSSVSRLLSDDREEVRTGGLDVVLQLKRNKTKEAVYTKCLDYVESVKNPSAKEQILIDEIKGNTKSQEILSDRGYGLYDPEVSVELTLPEYNETLLTSFFNIPTENLTKILGKLEDYIQEHAHLEYKGASGEEYLLGNGLRPITHEELPPEEIMPFQELWRDFYHKEIKDFKTLFNLYMAVNKGMSYSTKVPERIAKLEELILGKDIMGVEFQSISRNLYLRFDERDIIPVVLDILLSIYGDKHQIKEIAKSSFLCILHYLSKNPISLIMKEKSSYDRQILSFLESYEMIIYQKYLEEWKSEEEFAQRFTIYKRFDERLGVAVRNRYQWERRYYLNILDYVKAYDLGIIPEDMVYQAIFKKLGLEQSLKTLSYLFKQDIRHYEAVQLKKYGLEQDKVINQELYHKARHFYQTVVDKILDVELKRGDTPTVFSSSICHITCIFGMERLVEILVALGKDGLERSYYYYGEGASRKESLSHLLKVCYPNKGENAELLGKLLQGKGITKKRLIETTMYAPQWMDIMEEYLGMKGLKSGCYYFMAHMNDYFDEKKQAMIAKYTPIETEALNLGAFDLNWFKEAYETLGEKNFELLYDSAKYSSSGGKHARARKYADAALGKVTLEYLENTIADKRNKDLLMSYGLVPLGDKNDLLRRYEFLQKFLKQSKEFGAQRKASEGKAVEIALENLATAAGFQDVTRLTLMMESELVRAYEPQMEWKELGDYRVRLIIDELGRAEIEIYKKEKKLNSVPTTLKKEEHIELLKEIRKKLKDQYTRAKKMFEDAMENSIEFTFGELAEICSNPVVRPVLTSLVFVWEEAGEKSFGLLYKREGFQGVMGDVKQVRTECIVRVAHPFDLYQSGCWHSYQIYLLNQIRNTRLVKQPFKQVFRELYVKTEEELEKRNSLLFAGNQIYPQKTVSCLKNRKWIADYEEGLQKVYYKENIVARIYAMADWFSPSDIEAPTLEWVEFSDRKNFEALTIKQIPDIIYSEVMRDVDLAVSVAYAGGVDPEASHSTVEMRKVIIEFNLPLFGLDNVITIEGNHAIINGKRSSYSIHLGSGVIHRLGGPMLHVLPVHSQERGRLFLPFIDEDPKTAEIMSKIVLFAKDEKIKDPYILNQY